jgi:hypothetical protein
MAIVDANKTFYEIKNKKLNNLSILRMFNILRDTDDKQYFVNIFRTFELEESLYRSIIYFISYEISDEDRFLDNVSYINYDTPYLWWIIALVNNVQNPFEDIDIGDNIKVLKNVYISTLLNDVEKIGNL